MTDEDAHRPVRVHDARRARSQRGPRPGAPATGWDTTRRWFWVTLSVVAAATLVLVALVAG